MPRPGPKSTFTTAMRFALWASQRERPPTWREIQGFLQCTSTKARQWRRFYLAALPIPPPPAATGPTPQRRQP